MDKQLIATLHKMAHSEIRNYVLPGLSSYLIGGAWERGQVRMFKSSRETHWFVTPHSHRFDFTCLVLRGSVRNTLFTEDKRLGDWWAVSKLRGRLGQYTTSWSGTTARFVAQEREWTTGDAYSMNAEQIHSVRFSTDAIVLLFEGPEVHSEVSILEPWTEAEGRVETFGLRPWMFKKATGHDDE